MTDKGSAGLLWRTPYERLRVASGKYSRPPLATAFARPPHSVGVASRPGVGAELPPCRDGGRGRRCPRRRRSGGSPGGGVWAGRRQPPPFGAHSAVSARLPHAI